MLSFMSEVKVCDKTTTPLHVDLHSRPVSAGSMSTHVLTFVNFVDIIYDICGKIGAQGIVLEELQ
jgi:hypothetical protein